MRSQLQLSSTYLAELDPGAYDIVHFLTSAFGRLLPFRVRQLSTVDSTGERNTLRRMEECSHEVETSDVLF